MDKILTQEYLKKILEYNPESGLFTWKVKKSCRNTIGATAGTVSKLGYISISIDSRLYCSHRLAWLYTYGEFPSTGIDHIDGNPSNNAICNLRATSQSGNNKNVAKRKDNKSGYKGVSWCSITNKWKAQAQVDGKKKYIGVFNTPEEAFSAYVTFTTEAFGEYYRDTAI
jgi:HNH endonuclease/AP2 domain